MKNYALMALTVLLTIGCNSQEKKKGTSGENQAATTEKPKGSWEVNKEFDSEGNLIRYDSIYSWSSAQGLDNLSPHNRDSILSSLESRFYQHFSNFGLHGQDPSGLFAEDSLFTRRFFDDDFFESEFGKDFMDIDRMHKRLERIQHEFLEKYGTGFDGRDKGATTGK